MNAWDRVRAALLANGAKEGDFTMEFFEQARGHINCAAALQSLLDDVTVCSCGEETPCGTGDESPERIETREALTALLAEISA